MFYNYVQHFYNESRDNNWKNAGQELIQREIQREIQRKEQLALEQQQLVLQQQQIKKNVEELHNMYIECIEYNDSCAKEREDIEKQIDELIEQGKEIKQKYNILKKELDDKIYAPFDPSANTNVFQYQQQLRNFKKDNTNIAEKIMKMRKEIVDNKFRCFDATIH